MTTEELNSETRVAQSRMPSRVAGFSLGALFVGFGLFQLLVGAADWVAGGFAILVALIGLQFVCSAFTGHWKAPYAWRRRQMHSPPRFLVVEPASFGVAESQNNCRSDSLETAINPYAPPLDLPTSSTALGTPSQEATLQTLVRQFLDGYPFIHYGVVFLLEIGDDTAIHAALPLSSPSDLLIRRNTKEAIRVLPEFLRTLPGTRAVLSGRNLVVRMISSYTDLHDEVSNRTVVPWERATR